MAKIEQGLTAQRIYQDLVTDYAFTAKYHSVRRYVSSLLDSKVLPVRRIEVEAGQEMQIDYGQADWYDPELNPKIITFYQRLKSKGKESKVAIVACMRKLITILNLLIKTDQLWITK